MTTTTTSILSSNLFGSLAASAVGSLTPKRSGGTGTEVRSDPARWAMNQTATVDSHVLNVQLRTLSDDLSRHETGQTALSSVKGNLARLHELADELHAGVDLTETEIGAMETEFTDLAAQIDALVANTSYAGQGLLDGSAGSLADATTATGIELADYGSYLDASNGLVSVQEAMVTPTLSIQGGLAPLQHQSGAIMSRIGVLDDASNRTATIDQASGLATDVRNEILTLVADMLASVTNDSSDMDRMFAMLRDVEG